MTCYLRSLFISVYSRIKKGKAEKIPKEHFYLLGAHMRRAIVMRFYGVWGQHIHPPRDYFLIDALC